MIFAVIGVIVAFIMFAIVHGGSERDSPAKIERDYEEWIRQLRREKLK